MGLARLPALLATLCVKRASTCRKRNIGIVPQKQRVRQSWDWWFGSMQGRLNVEAQQAP